MIDWGIIPKPKQDDTYDSVDDEEQVLMQECE